MESFSDKSKAQKDWPRKHFQMDENETYESAMMCWESLEDSEQASKKRKTSGQDAETNDDKEMQADEMDDEKHIMHTVDTGNRLNIPVEELKLGADDDTLTLTTQRNFGEKFSVHHEHPRRKIRYHKKCMRYWHEFKQTGRQED